MRIAIVGTGISGLMAAHRLHPRHDITVFEADDRIGGHVRTVDVETDGTCVSVDTGFIVANEATYPNLFALFDELGVATQPSEMSFSVSDQAAGIEYRASRISTIYAQPRNFLRPGFQRMLIDILRFNRALAKVADSEMEDPSESLAEFVARAKYSDAFVERFLVPLGASIWSADPTTFLDFPVTTYARFMANHGLTSVRSHPQWRTVSGGSRTYVDALVAPFTHRIRFATPVDKVTRLPGAREVELVSSAGTARFDRVVLATHSDQALALLSDPSDAEAEILGGIAYQSNVATLHRDERFLPRHRRARASWNFHVGEGDGHTATVTYWMNLLQSLPASSPLLVTLNRSGDIDPSAVIEHIEYHHPVFDEAAIRAQRRRHEIQGVDGTYFAGAYWGNGFHEDGLVSALDAVASLEGR